MAVTTVGGAETAVHRGLIGKQGMGSSFAAMAAIVSGLFNTRSAPRSPKRCQQ